MAGVDDRRYDVKDILDRATYGWVVQPPKPTLIVEERDNPIGSYFGDQTFHLTNGVIFIKKNYSFSRIKHCTTVETRVWEFPCVIIAESHILLQGIFDQMREVFDRYTNPTANTPFSTSTLGTSTTYNYAGIERGTVDYRINHFAMDVTVFLKEAFVDVVVA